MLFCQKQITQLKYPVQENTILNWLQNASQHLVVEHVGFKKAWRNTTLGKLMQQFQNKLTISGVFLNTVWSLFSEMTRFLSPPQHFTLSQDYDVCLTSYFSVFANYSHVYALHIYTEINYYNWKAINDKNLNIW